jgi:hypothetical protein
MIIVLWYGEYKRQPLLGNGAINGDTTLQHVTPRNVTNGNTAGYGVFYVARADLYVMKQ